MPMPESAGCQGVGCGGSLLRTVRSGVVILRCCGPCFLVVSEQWGHRRRPSVFLVFAIVEVEVAFST